MSPSSPIIPKRSSSPSSRATSQSPSKPYNASQSPSGPSPRKTPEEPTSSPEHPHDAFTVLRLSARLPLPSSNDDDDDDDDDADDANSHASLSDRGARPRTRIQSLELCFHADFLTSSATVFDDRPFSLHFTSPPQPIIFYMVPPLLKPPTPPYYIHEIPDVIDLTRESGSPGDEASPVRLPGRSIAFAVCVFVLAALFAALGFLAGCRTKTPFDWGNVQANLPADARVDMPGVTIPREMISPAGQRYTFSFASENRSVALHRKIMTLQHHRLALQPPLIEALDRIWSLSDFETIVQRLCLHVTVHTGSLGDDDNSDGGDSDAELVCEHLLRRFRNVIATWIELRTSADFETIPSNLAHAARLLDISAVDSIGDVFRAALFNADRDPFVAACRLCDTAAQPTRSAHDPAMPVSPPAGSWHFACLPDFAHTTANNNTININNKTTTTFLLDWAAAQSARRFETLHNAPLDLDDSPLFPDNQHPFAEADEVISAKLPAETAVFALTRHLVEVAVSISVLAKLLEATSEAASSDGYKPGEAGESPSSHTHTRHPVPPSWLSSWLGLGSPQRSAATTTAAITDGVNSLQAIRNSTLVPIIRLLGQVAVGLSSGCMLSADVLSDVDRLERTGLAGWETTETSARAPTSGVDAGAPTVIELKHVLYTFDPKLEGESLSRASELVRGILKGRPAPRMALHGGTLEDVPKGPGKASRVTPRDDREAVFLEGLRNGGLLGQQRGGLFDMLQGFRETVEEAARDDDAGGGEDGPKG